MPPLFATTIRRTLVILMVPAISSNSVATSYAQTITVPNGVPQGPIPTYEEVGVGGFAFPSSGGSRTIGSDGSTVTTSPTNSGADSASLQKMYSASWGYQAGQNAETVGITSDALASACVLESGCQNQQSVAGKSGITGAFQMMQSTYDQEIAKAVAAHPELAEQVSSTSDGQHDPAVQAIAAAQYIKDGAESLQRNGVSNPNSVDVRGYYNFGPASGIALAKAADSDNMAATLKNNRLSAADLAKNGISLTETVGEWRSAVASKLGSSATNGVLK